VISIIQKNDVIVLHKKRHSIKSIAKELGISRNTIRSYIREYQTNLEQLSNESDTVKIKLLQEAICSKPMRKKAPKHCIAFTREVEQRFNELIKLDEKRNETLGKNKQQVTAALLHRTLVSEGFKVGESTIRAKFREYKQKQNECFVKQFYEYGDIAQYDFHQVKLVINNLIKIYHQATISIPKSNIIFAVLYTNEKMENFLDSIVQFFHFCRGVFRKMIFDNMSNVVKRFLFKNEKEYTDNLLKISNYYGFKIETCNPRSGNEKGHVENSGKVIRRDFFCFKYQFDSEEELYEYFEYKLAERNQPYMEEFEKEQQYLLPLSPHSYELGRLQKAKVDSYSLISIDGNFYSVPDKYVNKVVICNIYTKYLIIFDDKNNLIAEHKKKDGSGEYTLRLDHYYVTLQKKPKALKNSYALKQAPKILQTIFNQYFSTKPREFLHFLIETDAFNDNFYELGIEVGTFKKSKYRRTMEFYKESNKISDIDQYSIKQLEQTSDLFGQEVPNE